jgi:hypothetical protein
VRRLSLHRPSPATVISLVALFFAMSGTAVAATGGNFLLGKSNTASSVSSLSNTKGTALSLSSTSTTPPLKVSNSVQVPNLNASELDGQASSAFLPTNGTAANSSELGGQPASAYLGVNGTAANSSELGGIPASGFIQGDGAISGGRQSLSNPNTAMLVSAPGSDIAALCGYLPAINELILDNTSASNMLASWWGPSGLYQATIPSGGSQLLNGHPQQTYMLVVQVDTGSNIATYTVTTSYNSSANTCRYTGQVVNSNG